MTSPRARFLNHIKRIIFNEIGGSECLNCAEPNVTKLLVHHKKYTNKSVTYNQFEDSDVGRIQYYAKLLDEVIANPSNLIVLCFDCHNQLHRLLKMKWHDAYNWLNSHTDDWDTCKLGLENLWEEEVESWK